MKLKLKKISTKSFVVIFSVLNVVGGFILGAIVTVVSLTSPTEQINGEIGPWAIILFPILNGILALATGSFLSGLYNLLSKYLGGIELEFEIIEAPSKA